MLVENLQDAGITGEKCTYRMPSETPQNYRKPVKLDPLPEHRLCFMVDRYPKADMIPWRFRRQPSQFRQGGYTLRQRKCNPPRATTKTR